MLDQRQTFELKAEHIQFNMIYLNFQIFAIKHSNI